MTKRKRRGRGQTYTATPDLRDYVTPPASDVVVRALDGTVLRTEPAKAEAEPPPRRRRRRR